MSGRGSKRVRGKPNRFVTGIIGVKSVGAAAHVRERPYAGVVNAGDGARARVVRSTWRCFTRSLWINNRYPVRACTFCLYIAHHASVFHVRVCTSYPLNTCTMSFSRRLLSPAARSVTARAADGRAVVVAAGDYVGRIRVGEHGFTLRAPPSNACAVVKLGGDPSRAISSHSPSPEHQWSRAGSAERVYTRAHKLCVLSLVAVRIGRYGWWRGDKNYEKEKVHWR